MYWFIVNINSVHFTGRVESREYDKRVGCIDYVVRVVACNRFAVVELIGSIMC